MTEKEKDILKNVVDSREGQISPATIINGYASGDQGSVERLVSQGYLERVYQFREGLHQATYSIIFYAVTEKGLMYFAPLLNRWWFNFRSQTALWVGLVSMVVSLLALGTTIFFSAQQNKRETLDFQLRARPYLVITQVESKAVNEGTKYRLHLKNVGVLPAKIRGGLISCDGLGRKNYEEKNLVGNGEELVFDFNVSTSTTVMCDYSVRYSVPTQSFGENEYSTTYKFDASAGKLLSVDATLQ